jgi:putative oxidoreductase
MKWILEAILSTRANLGNLILRAMVGSIFIAHGSQKLFGWFGGGGPVGFSNFLKSINIPFPLISAYLAASSEFFGGLALLLGFLTRLTVFPIMVVMWVAIVYVHGAHGFFGQDGGFEYPLLLLVVQIYFLITGAGSCSLDRWIVRRMHQNV